MSKIALLFPGQGSQYVGMGKDLSENFPLFQQTIEETEDLLKLPLRRAMFDGPASLLLGSDICQVAIFTLSVGIFRLIEQRLPSLQAEYFAGLSLGEYSALYASKMASFTDLLDLVARRAQLMQQACMEKKTAMAAVMGADFARTGELIEQTGSKVYLCNDNAPTQTVVGGEPPELAKFAKKAAGLAKIKVRPLEVAGAFHTPFMEKAGKALTPCLETLALQKPVGALISNVTAEIVDDIEQYRSHLIKHMCSPVRWSPTVELLKDQKVRLSIEIGCGSVLSTLNRRNGARFASHNICDSAGLDAVLKELHPLAKERLYEGY